LSQTTVEHPDGKYTVKAVRGESAAAARLSAEDLITRAADEGFELHDSDLIGAEGGEVRVPSKSVGELIVDNSRINREGRGETYLSCGPELSNLPPSHPGS
jgi:hypothetical protein